MAGDDLLIKNIKRGELSFEWNDAPLLWQHVGPDRGQIRAAPGPDPRQKQTAVPSE